MTIKTIGLGVIMALALAGTARAQGAADYTPSWASKVGDTIIADFVQLQQTKLAELDALMDKACSSADCMDMQRAWWAIIDEMLAEFRTARDQARMAYAVNNRRPPSQPLPDEYAAWFTAQQEHWKFLRGQGSRAFLWIKQVQRQTQINIGTNIPGATHALAWFVEQTKTIDDAVGIIGGVRDKNLAKRYVSDYKSVKDLAKLVSEVHKQWSREEKQFLEKTDPKQYANYKVYFGDWKVSEDSMFFPLRDKWAERVAKAYQSYNKTYKALFVVADPVIEGDFMNDNGRIKRWKAGDVGKEFGSVYAELERRAAGR